MIRSSILTILLGTSLALWSCEVSRERLEDHLAAYNVIVFMEVECPISQQYSLTLQKIREDYASLDSLNFIALFTGKTGQKEAESFLDTYSLSFRAIADPDLAWAKQFRAEVTPEVYIVTRDLEVLSRGAIDNWYSALGQNRQVIDQHYLRDNLQALFSGKELPFPKTKAIGCFIEY